MTKRILLSGFSQKHILEIKKKYKKDIFFVYKPNHKYINKIDALISYSRKSFEKFYYSDFHKYKKSISWIHIASAGIENYFKKNELNKHCQLTTGKIIQGPQVADHAMALLLNLTRNLNTIIKEGPFVKFKKRPVELYNKNVLIIGYGGIGKNIAKRIIGFGVNIDILDNKKFSKSNLVNKSFLPTKLKDALKNKDIIFFSIPLTKKTTNMINKKTIKYIKKGAILINVCRGKIFCFKTIYKNLKNHYLGGVGTDVIDIEPIQKNNKLLNLANFLYTPHIAGISDNFFKRNMDLIFNNLDKFIKNKKLINKINLKTIDN